MNVFPCVAWLLHTEEEYEIKYANTAREWQTLERDPWLNRSSYFDEARNINIPKDQSRRCNFPKSANHSCPTQHYYKWPMRLRAYAETTCESIAERPTMAGSALREHQQHVHHGENRTSELANVTKLLES